MVELAASESAPFESAAPELLVIGSGKKPVQQGRGEAAQGEGVTLGRAAHFVCGVQRSSASAEFALAPIGFVALFRVRRPFACGVCAALAEEEGLGGGIPRSVRAVRG